MIIQVDTPEYADTFAAIYNSANTLFDNSEQYDVTGKIFLPQLKNDQNYICMYRQEVAGFMSFHCHGRYNELTSLYVKREFQNRGIGESLICYFEQKVKSSAPTFVKVLNNAPWALRFYQKHGFTFLDENKTESLKAMGITEKPWERILYLTLFGKEKEENADTGRNA